MRRWLAIFLLVLLPFQFSWAAVAAYCGHESGTQAQHFGHHEHQHADHAKGVKHADPSGKGGSSVLDFDCGHCHSTCCSLPAMIGAPVSPLLAAEPLAPVHGPVRTLAQNPPERPQWLRFA